MSKLPESGARKDSITKPTTTSTKSKLPKLFKLFKRTGSSKSPRDITPGTDTLKFVCISDTHTYTDHTKIPDGDVLLHAGDFSMKGTLGEIKKFNDFLGRLPHQWKIVIAGNHDRYIESKEKTKPEYYKRLKHLLEESYGVSRCCDLLTNCIYLEDELVDICGIRIYGSPWTLQYRGYDAFQLPSGQCMKDKWDQIPDSVDILMTHGPPYGICDTTKRDFHAGCKDLLTAVQTRVKPKIHLFGHIHEGYGEYFDGTTRFINASVCTVNYHTTNSPFIVCIEPPTVCNSSAEREIASNRDSDTNSDGLDTNSVRHKQYQDRTKSYNNVIQEEHGKYAPYQLQVTSTNL